MTETPTRLDTDSGRPAPAADEPGVPADTRLRLPASLRQELARLAELSYPYEACGVLLGLTAGSLVAVERIVHGRNLNLERLRDRYLLDPDDFLAADRVARAAGLEIVGIWHSHPDGSPRPSRTDLEAAWEGYSYVIVSVAAVGTARLRSWRLREGKFVLEDLVG